MQYRLGGVVAWCAHDATTRVSAGAAEVEPLNGSTIACTFRGRTQREELIGSDLAVEDIAVGHAVAVFVCGVNDCFQKYIQTYSL